MLKMGCLEKEEGHLCTNTNRRRRLEDKRRRHRSKTSERFSKRRRARGFESTVACRKLEISLPVNRCRRGRGDIEGGFGSGGRTRRKRRGDGKKRKK
jgi:hypothetical protein